MKKLVITFILAICCTAVVQADCIDLLVELYDLGASDELANYYYAKCLE